MTNRREMRERIRWKKYFTSRIRKNRKGLHVGGYAIGCRNHPGIITYYDGWDLSLKSLFDGIEENCSIYHCAPFPISKAAAEQYTSYYQTHGEKMFNFWFHESGYNRWVEQWHNLKEGDYGFGESLQNYLHFSDEDMKTFLNRDWPENDTRPIPFDD